MDTLTDLGKEVLKIREAIDSIEIKGVDQIKKNIPFLAYAYDRCNFVIQSINQIAERQNGVNEGREDDGKQN